jgi:hypothetical protein
MIGDSEQKVPINLSLPQNVVERYYYEANRHREKRKFVHGDFPVEVSVGYDGNELDSDDVELVEQYLAWRHYEPVKRHF